MIGICTSRLSLELELYLKNCNKDMTFCKPMLIFTQRDWDLASKLSLELELHLPVIRISTCRDVNQLSLDLDQNLETYLGVIGIWTGLL